MRPPSRKRHIACTVLALPLLLSTLRPAAAQILSVDSCTVSSNPVSFGVHDPLTSTSLTSQGSVTVTCQLISGVSLLVAYSIALSKGSGTFATRTMQSGSSVLNYNLYTSSSYAAVWGDGTAGTTLPRDGYLLGLGNVVLTYTVYGRVSALQNVSAGSYFDNILITVTY